MGREEYNICKQILLVCVASVLAMYGPHWVCPSSQQPVLSCLHSSGSRFSAEYCLKQTLCFMHFPCLSCSGTDSRVSPRAQTHFGLRFVPFPGSSSSGDQVLGEHTVPGGLCILITSPVLAAQFPRFAMRALSQVCCVSPLGS